MLKVTTKLNINQLLKKFARSQTFKAGFAVVALLVGTISFLNADINYHPLTEQTLVSSTTIDYFLKSVNSALANYPNAPLQTQYLKKGGKTLNVYFMNPSDLAYKNQEVLSVFKKASSTAYKEDNFYIKSGQNQAYYDALFYSLNLFTQAVLDNCQAFPNDPLNQDFINGPKTFNAYFVNENSTILSGTNASSVGDDIFLKINQSKKYYDTNTNHEFKTHLYQFDKYGHIITNNAFSPKTYAFLNIAQEASANTCEQLARYTFDFQTMDKNAWDDSINDDDARFDAIFNIIKRDNPHFSAEQTKNAALLRFFKLYFNNPGYLSKEFPKNLVDYSMYTQNENIVSDYFKPRYASLRANEDKFCQLFFDCYKDIPSLYACLGNLSNSDYQECVNRFDKNLDYYDSTKYYGEQRTILYQQRLVQNIPNLLQFFNIGYQWSPDFISYEDEDKLQAVFTQRFGYPLAGIGSNVPRKTFDQEIQAAYY